MKYVMRLVTAIAISWVTFAIPARALDDTPETRAAQADIYLRVVPAKSLMNEMSEKIAATLPEDQRTLLHNAA